MTNLKKITILTIVLSVALICWTSYFVLDSRKYMYDHKEWTKTIKAPFDGQFKIINGYTKCHIDTIIGDSVRITAIVHRNNIWK